MSRTTLPSGAPSLTLKAWTASELMTANPVSIRREATVREAASFLTDQNISAATVINHAGRPVGVLSRTDIVDYDRQGQGDPTPQMAPPSVSELKLATGEVLKEGFQVAEGDTTQVFEIMTPVVFAVDEDATSEEVVDEMLARQVHRLFVVDSHGVLVGVVSALDIIRKLEPVVAER